MSMKEKASESKLVKWLMNTPLGTLVKQLFSFGIIGVINTVLGWVLYGLFYYVCHMGYWGSTITSYIIGSIFSYVANKKMTFNVKGNTKSTAIRFAINIGVCFVVAFALARPVIRAIMPGVSGLVDGISPALAATLLKTSSIETVAYFVGEALFIMMNFIGQKFFVFRTKKEVETKEETSVED